MIVKLLLAMVLAILLLSGCAATVTPPAVVEQPRTVWLFQHARHSSLLLTAADNTRVRYAYGDWAWYVEEQEGLYSGARALLWPSRAALGRLALPPAQQGEQLARVIGVGIDRAHCMQLDGRLVDQLLAELDSRYRAANATSHFSSTRNLHFVPHPRAYTLLHNSNHVTAGWLRELGVQVSGSSALEEWSFAIAASGFAGSFDFTAGNMCP